MSFALTTSLLILVTCSSAQKLLGKVIMILDDQVKLCGDPKERANVIDFSNYELIATSEDDVFANGSIRFARDMGTDPVPFEMVAEKKRQGEWTVTALSLKRADWCTYIHDPKEIFYKKMKDFKCPAAAGESWDFDMMSLVDMPIVYPPDFVGEWRATLKMGFNTDGVVKFDCVRYHFDLVFE